MDKFPGGRSLIYKSDNIYERRRRVLQEARKMISEDGLSGFSVRELCARSGIAQKTLYNAFGSKENVIALTIRDYQSEFDELSPSRLDPATIEGRLERLIKVHSRNLQIRPYTSAIMTLYSSPTADRAIRQAIRSVSEAPVRPLAESLEESGALAPGVSAASFMDLHISSTYALLTDWSLGDLADDQLIDRICEGFLIVVLGMTRGQTKTDAEHWLEDLRAKRPSWTAMRRMAEVEPRPTPPSGDASPAHASSADGTSSQNGPKDRLASGAGG